MNRISTSTLLRSKILWCALLLIVIIGSAMWLQANERESIESVVATADLPGMPPDPGEAGKKTLEGIDSDHDGVRDDVQRWIAMNVTQPTSIMTKVNTLARLQLEMLVQAVNSPSDVQTTNEAGSRVIYCIAYLLGEGAGRTVTEGLEAVYNLNEALENVVQNTAARRLAFQQSNKLLSGMYTIPASSVWAEYCQ